MRIESQTPSRSRDPNDRKDEDVLWHRKETSIGES